MFSPESIAKIEKVKNAKYVGTYDLDRGSMDVTISGPVFYVENPDVSQGHSNYFALFYDMTGQLLITGASHLTEKKYPAIKFGEDDYLVSRGRHDCVTRDGAMLDGGGSGYTRTKPDHPITHWMRIVDGKEVFEEFDYGQSSYRT